MLDDDRSPNPKPKIIYRHILPSIVDDGEMSSGGGFLISAIKAVDARAHGGM